MKQISVKFAGVFAVLAFAVTATTPASAQTIAELQALIAQLTQQIAAMSGGTSNPATGTTYTYSMDLTLGSTGADVVALQTFLESKGVLTIPAGVSKGYFGELTRAALARYQAMNGISPAVGYFGPMTRAKVNQESVTVTNPGTNPGTPSTPGSLSGEGDVEIDVTLDGSIDIDLGDTEEVIVLDVEAVDGDVRIDRMDFLFSGEDADEDAVSARPWLYFDEVVLEVDGREVASLSRSSDFTDVDGDYRARFSGLNLVIEEDDKVEVTLKVTALASMQGDRVDHTIFVDFDTTEDVRFVDGSGAVLFGATGEDAAAQITFTDEFGTGDVSVTIGDNSPEDAVIVLDEDNRTNGVTVLEFDVEADNDDIEVQDVLVTFNKGTSTTTVSNLLYRAYLYQGSTLLKSKSVSGDEVIFDDIEFAIDEDDTEMFTVKVDFNKVANKADIDEFIVASTTVTYEDSDFVLDSETLQVNETHQLVVEGLVDEFTKKSATLVSQGTNKSNGVYTFEFDLTAYEDEFYIAEDGSDFGVTLSNTASTTLVRTQIAATNATLVNNGDSYRINKGQTRTFTVTVEVQANTGVGSVSNQVTLDDLVYNTDADLDGVDATLTLGAPDYRSTAVSLFDNN